MIEWTTVLAGRKVGGFNLKYIGELPPMIEASDSLPIEASEGKRHGSMRTDIS